MIRNRMIRNRFYRLATLMVLVGSLTLLPAAADAAPRDRHEPGAVGLLASAWDWISNVWGAGGGSWDPNRQPTIEPTVLVGESPRGDGEVSASRTEGRLEADRQGRMVRNAVR